ncbi:hypothetical protein ACDP63_22355 [Paracoccus sp. P2]|uniref:Uncharacterized protein n=1 Tax=Paracoccus pantotrophus TaxID=82367 RepID=A0A1I5MI77_PARPN|nr:hypothetical protein [Paracoccus pantotrophus]MDF3856295.1 hypothetical protein [Paracoccus pantotrophus]QFG34940.1 hypothetical protein ESD82_01680 [Paracoccus pantotrophus]QLH13206.1 hypothetical protein HYQ43_02620 [Paracoccus pantotrophus]RDD96494.1 hypothetical protein DTW92_12525 [Paracoccus pantotrophus]RKS44890.1 hypothetical protein BDE18_3749 [Paracoccus pantotrophus]
MSAPRTDLEKQRRRHLVPILGILAAVLIVLAGFVWWFNDETSDPEIPGQVPGPVDEIAEPPAAGMETGVETAPATLPGPETAPAAGTGQPTQPMP